MKWLRFIAGAGLGWWIWLQPAAVGLAESQEDSLPPAAKGVVDFAHDIVPIFNESCIKCHGRGRAKGGFRIDSRETLLKGSDNGPVVQSGRSEESRLIELVAGQDPDLVMPKKGSRLTEGEVGKLRAWIDQGLPWSDGVFLGALPPANLTPRHPELPPVRKEGWEHPIDRWVRVYFEKQGIDPPEPVSDRRYARRVYLDLLGVIPDLQELDRFVEDTRPEKRKRLVHRLLADETRYAQHWLSFWNDMLRNDYAGTGYIDGGRKQITEWLYTALAENKPYDQFVSELVDPVEGSEGFIKGIVWRGVVNASQRPEMQAAQNISQVFMGVNLKCASCHDSFINDWQLSDAYGMASIYADEGPLEMYRCDKPTGQTSPARFLFPELGPIDGVAPREKRMEQLARVLTSEENGRLTRTIVNRLWERFFGRGLVEPIDVMENESWYPDLLDWLAGELVRRDYDLKKIMACIVTSRAYQLPAVAADDSDPVDYQFRGPLVRRMSAEQLLDSLASMTGVGYDRPAGEFNLLAGTPYGDQPGKRWRQAPASAKWIWSEPKADEAAPAGTIFLRKEFELSRVPNEAVVISSCDNRYRLQVNGQTVVEDDSWEQPEVKEIRHLLRPGKNWVQVEATNDEGNGPNPAGLLFYARLRGQSSDIADGEAQIMDFASDSSWDVRRTDPAEEDSDSACWSAAVELGDPDMGPWDYSQRLASALELAGNRGRVRAGMVRNDALMRALGRPSRDVVVTSRPSEANTLQALELTNGETLARFLRDGARRLLAEGPDEPEPMVQRLYRHALSRSPTAKEIQLATELLGDPIESRGLQDLLWALIMLPEFQLIY